MNEINLLMRHFIDRKNRKQLKNKEFSLFASNCNGACICHDLGLRFRSPFVNLRLSGPDFVKFLTAPREYLNCELSFLEQTERSFPVARLADITLYFQHYESEEEARLQWQRRQERINWDELFVMLTQRDGCTDEVLRAFDALPYRHKVVFTKEPRPDIQSAVYIPGFEKDKELGVCSAFVGKWNGRKYYDAFDYVAWFNGELDG